MDAFAADAERLGMTVEELAALVVSAAMDALDEMSAQNEEAA